MKFKKVPKQYTDRKLTARYPTDLGAWQALKKHHREVMQKKTLQELFARDKKRPQNFSLQAGDLLLDHSKTHVNKTTLKLLARLAREAAVPEAINAMFAGDPINATEGRSVLHVALRSKISDTVALDTPGVRDVWKVLTDMENFVDAVHANTLRGHTGKRLTHIVNIGIGGSDRSQDGTGSGDNLVRGLLKDLYDHRDDDQCQCGAAVDCPGTGRGRRELALCCGVYQPPGHG